VSKKLLGSSQNSDVNTVKKFDIKMLAKIRLESFEEEGYKF
jgi:hypothetical protein